MPYCPQCGNQHSAEACFCQHCGSRLQASAQTDQDGGAYPATYEWLSLQEVLGTRDRLFGAIGTVLAFIGAFMPWTQVTIWFSTQGVSSSLAWLVALAAIVAGVCLFRQRTGNIVMGIGIGILAVAFMALMGAMSNSSSPLIGVFVTLIGGGLLGYSGYLTNHYERGM